MIINKLIEVGLDLQKPVEVYSNLNDNVLNILKNTYEGKCFRECYIITIDDIIDISDGYVANTGNDSYVKIYVRFAATVREFTLGEVITGCKVTEKKAGIIICNTEYASVYLKENKLLSGVRIGQLIPVKFGSAKYSIGNNKISIKGLPFIFTNEPVAYHININSFSTDDLKFFDDVMKRVDYEEEQRKILLNENSSGVNFFDKLLYAWKTEQQTPKNATVVSLPDMIRNNKLNTGYVSLDNRLNMSSGSVYVFKDKPQTHKLLGDDAKAAIYHMLEQYSSHLRTIREMITIYNSKELLTNHNNIWQIFRIGQL